MTPIVSRTTTERIVRNSIFVAVFAGFAAFCWYDRYVRYPNQNLQNAIENLPVVLAEAPPINRRVNKASAERIAPGKTTLAELQDWFGPPGWQHPDAPEIRYFGEGGVLSVRTGGGARVESADWKMSQHKGEAELRFQLIMALVLTPFSVGALAFYLVRVLGFRCELEDAGLKHPGHPVIPFSAMKAMTYVKSGLYDLAYEKDGRQRTVRLDDYKIKAFDPIVEAICQQTGLTRPARPSSDAQAKT